MTMTANLNDTATPLGSLVRSLGLFRPAPKGPCDDKPRLHWPGVALTKREHTAFFGRLCDLQKRILIAKFTPLFKAVGTAEAFELFDMIPNSVRIYRLSTVIDTFWIRVRYSTVEDLPSRFVSLGYDRWIV